VDLMKTNVNLLPWTFRRDRLLRRRLRQWSCAWALGAAVLAGGWWIEWSACHAVLAEVAGKEQNYEAVKQLRGDIAKLTALQRGLGNQQNLLGALQAAPPPLLVVALVSQSAQHCQGRVMVRQLVYQHGSTRPGAGAFQAAVQAAPVVPTPPGAAQGAASAGPRASASLTLRGIGADNLAVAEFVVGLREAGVFERVDLKSAAESESTRSHTTVYQVECGF
jgi:hypothetical protein